MEELRHQRQLAQRHVQYDAQFAVASALCQPKVSICDYNLRKVCFAKGHLHDRGADPRVAHIATTSTKCARQPLLGAAARAADILLARWVRSREPPLQVSCSL